MAGVEIAHAAADDLRRFVLTHSLPPETPALASTSSDTLRTFPLLGPALHGRWEGFRFIVGLWRWLILGYRHFPDENRVVVVTIEDARASSAVTRQRAFTLGASGLRALAGCRDRLAGSDA